MTNEVQLLDIDKINPILSKYKKTYLYEAMGLNRGDGSRLMGEGILPRKDGTKERVLKKLSELTGLGLSELLITLVPSQH